MAKRPTLTDIGSGYTSNTTLNSNFDKIREAFDNTLSRDGSSPNQMEADLDLNSNDILNAKDGEFTGSLTVAGVDINDLLDGVGPGTVFNTTNRFNGDGSTVVFTLTRSAGARANTMVFINGVYQQKDTYTVSGTTLTFSTAPPVGTNNIEVNIQESTEGASLDDLDAASIKTLYESNADTNAFTDAEKTKLANITEVDLGVAQAATTVTVTNTEGTDATLPAATTSLAGVLTSVDKAKLDGIEASADVNPTDAEIAASYANEVPQVSGAERTAGTETAVRRFSPEDVAAMAAVHGGGGSGGDDFATRPAFITWVATESVSDGTVVYADGIGYRKETGANDISDATNWRPVGQTATPKHFGAIADAQSSATGSISSNSSTLTAGPVFASGDVGKAIKIEGAGVSGGDLVTTIATYVSATQVTLTNTASTTVSSANFTWGTDDTDAIDAAFAWIDNGGILKQNDGSVRSIFEIGVNRNVYIDPGFYIYNGAGVRMQSNGGRNIVVRGDDPSNALIAIFSDSYLIDLQVGDPAPNSIFCYGFTTFGGKGLYLNRQTTSVPQGYQTFDRVRVLGFSELAIGSLWEDSPRWTITNTLIETNKPNTRGVLCPPGVAHSKYYNLTITGCTYKFVLSDHFMSSQIMSGMTFFNLPDDDHEADIWIQPVDLGTYSSNFGQGVTFTMNRFSGENRGGKPIVLIAEPDGVGDYWTQDPSLSASTRVFRDMRIVNNVMTGQGTADSGGGPVVQSYTADLGNIEIADNSMSVAFSHLLKLETDPVSGYINDAHLGPNHIHGAGGERALPCNKDLGQWLHEDGTEGPSAGTHYASNGGWDHSYFLLSTVVSGDAVGTADWVYGGSASSAVTPGPFGQGTARQVTFSTSAGTDYVQIPVRQIGLIEPGQNMFLEFDIASDASRPITELDVEVVIASTGGGRTISRSFVPSSNWRHVIIPIRANDTMSGLQIRFTPSPDGFTASTADRVLIDNATVYAANRPVNTGHSFTQNAGWEKAHTVMNETSGQGELHIWPDWTNEALRADFAAPTSETAGSLIPLMLNSGAGRFVTITIEGSTTAGTGTYSQNRAYFMEIGNFVVGFGYLNWSAHTGTGNMRINLDYAPATRNSNAANRGVFLVSYFTGFTLPTTNSQISGFIERNTNLITVQYRRNTGDTPLPLPTSGEINFMFAYEKA